ncbi:MAG: hypothetical protein M0D55_18385 [Elusimicrobiota bacterium]|nr:MAG: hypothetical protein M0D55_18385 [Elusimicrobiota bacterium]
MPIAERRRRARARTSPSVSAPTPIVRRWGCASTTRCVIVEPAVEQATS